MSTETPLSAAASAAESAAFPAPTTTTSTDDGNMYMNPDFPDGGSDAENPVDRDAGGSYTSGRMAATTHSLAAINAMPAADFVAALGDVFEHAPWVAERAVAGRPFPSMAALHEA